MRGSQQGPERHGPTAHCHSPVPLCHSRAREGRAFPNKVLAPRGPKPRLWGSPVAPSVQTHHGYRVALGPRNPSAPGAAQNKPPAPTGGEPGRSGIGNWGLTGPPPGILSRTCQNGGALTTRPGDASPPLPLHPWHRRSGGLPWLALYATPPAKHPESTPESLPGDAGTSPTE